MPAYFMQYVYAEPFHIGNTQHPEAQYLVGQRAICLYLEMNNRAAKAERKVITIADAIKLRDDLNKLLRLQDEGENYLPSEDWTPDEDDTD